VADRKESELEKTGSSAPQHPAQKQLIGYYIAELERPFGPRVAWEALASGVSQRRDPRAWQKRGDYRTAPYGRLGGVHGYPKAVELMKMLQFS
jgi:hypothetical protein